MNLGPFERIDHTAFTDVGEANDVMPGPFQMPGSYADAGPQSGVGASWRRCLSHAWAFSRGIRSTARYN
jgi:hypothetical protein